MNGKVHVAIGVATTVCLCLKYPTGVELFGMPMLPGIMLLSVPAGSYAPDADSPRTHAGAKHKGMSKVINKVGGGHRGITHTLLFPIVLTACCYFIQHTLSAYHALNVFLLSIVGGFLLGWVLHILTDLLNGKGCPIFWPLMKSKVHIIDLPSTGIVPWIVVAVYSAFIAFITIGGFIK